MNDDHLRMSDEERERAGAELGEHYALGRIDSTEHGERLDRIWAARTRGELGPIFRDLPGQGYGRGPTRPRAPFGTPANPAPAAWVPVGGVARRRRGLPTPVIVVLCLLLAVTVLTNLPVIVLGLVVWLVLRSRGRRHPGWGHPAPGWDRSQRRR
jgi:hypothetical protein